MIWLRIVLELVIGFAVLAWSADRFVLASSAIAKHFKMPPLIIGMLLVGFGTSFPELVISALASLHGSSGLAIGNVLGSNIANVGLVIGVVALIMPMVIHSKILKREFPIMIVITLIVGALLINDILSRLDGFILLLMLFGYLFWVLRIAKKENHVEKDEMTREFESEMPADMKLSKAFTWWFIGLILLLVSSELVVDSATLIAKLLHISDLVIGLTIVAIGTSLPELAASVMSVLRKENDIAIGNIVGSNIFNLLAVLAVPAFIAPGQLPAHALTRDYPIMLGFTLVFWILPFLWPNKGKISRASGLFLTLSYFAYLAYLVVSTTRF